MNNAVQRKKINRFLKGKSKKDIDAFCIYQWIDRCHFEGWYDDAVALGSFIPPNSLNQDYQKRIEFLLGQCRNQINDRKDRFVKIGNSHDAQTYPIPKSFIDKLAAMGLQLDGHGQNRMRLKYHGQRLLLLEKMTFEHCTFYFIDRSCDSLLMWLDNNGFDYLADSLRTTKKNTDERRPRMRILWDDAISLLPSLFTRDYLTEIEKAITEKDIKTSPSAKWNQFGHRIGSQAAKIDDLLLEGASLKSIAVATGSTIGRVKAHIRHLRNEKGMSVPKFGNIYKIWMLGTSPKILEKHKRTSDTRATQLKFWEEFRSYTLKNKSTLNIRSVFPKHWLDIYFGHNLCHICMTINIRNNLMTCELYINDSKEFYRKLFNDRNAIEKKLGEALQWNELPSKKASRIKLIRSSDVTNQDNWIEYFEWMKVKAEAFDKVFSKYGGFDLLLEAE